MTTSTLLRFLVVGIFLAIKCNLALALAQLQQGDTDGRSHAALIVYEMMGDVYELKYEIKHMAEKIVRLEENQESVETAAEEKMISQAKKIETLETSVAGQSEKIRLLEDKLKSQENYATSQMEKIEELKNYATGQSEKIKLLEEKLNSQESYATGQSEKIDELEGMIESLRNSSEKIRESQEKKIGLLETYTREQSEKIVKLEGILESVETSAAETIGAMEKKIESLKAVLNLQTVSAVGQSEKIKILEGKLKSQETSSASQTEKIEKLEDKIESMEDDSAVGHSGAIKTLEEKLESLENYTKGMRSAFTVTLPVEGSARNTARFTHAVTNIGGHYSTSTGKFKCEYPGIYVFTLYILQESRFDYAGCSIRKNSQSVSKEAHSNPTGNGGSGYFSSSTSVILQLVLGDIVDVHCRSGLGSIHSSYSSFSGFLNKAD